MGETFCEKYVEVRTTASNCVEPDRQLSLPAVHSNLINYIRNCRDISDVSLNSVCHVQSSADHGGSHIEFAHKRLQLAQSLYYKALESILLYEKQRIDQRKHNADFSVSVSESTSLTRA